MNEHLLQLLALGRLLGITAFAAFYAYGGINHKPLRRYYGTLLLTGLYCLFSALEGTFSWFYLMCYPLLIAATSIGYGADSTGMKIWKRFYCGAAYSCAMLPIAFVTQNWTMFALHTFLCLTMSITLGVINPVNARKEETMIGTTIGLIPLFTV